MKNCVDLNDCSSAFFSLFTLFILTSLASCWPDGAPCIHSVMQSINPLEAVEHQGGLQLTPPPFYIQTERNCYWRNQAIELTLVGNSTGEKFKGFAIQPLIFSGTRVGQRIGQFLRLDDNGSWQQQCFRQRDSVTHSHDEPKTRMTLWWRNDDDDTNVVQFVATVVVSLRKFWVKSVFSMPLPPCRAQSEFAGWQRPTVITPPPPVSSFKRDTFSMFNKEQSVFLEQSFANLPDRAKQLPPKPFPSFAASAPPPTAASVTFAPAVLISAPTPAHRRLTQVIPIADMETNRRPNRLFNSVTAAPTTIQQQQQTVFQQQRFQQQRQRQLQMQQQQQPNICRDLELPRRCVGWLPFCASSLYMRNFCRRTCQFC